MIKVNDMDGKETKKIIKIFFAWQEEKEANWLCEMSKKGWHLRGVRLFCYTFQKGRPRDYTYRFDFKVLKKDDIDEYTAIFKDAGWAYIESMGSWHYFRTEGGEGLEPELYNDNSSRIEKYKRLLIVLIITFPPILFWVLPNLYMRMIDMASDSILNNPVVFKIYLPFVIILTIVEVFVLYGIIRVLSIINKLKKKIRE